MGGKHRKAKVGVEPEVRKAHARVVHAHSRGSHVGLTSPDDALDVDQSSANARDTRQ